MDEAGAMVRKLFHTGNSLAIAVPAAAAALLGLADGDYVEVELDAVAGALLIWPREAHRRRVPSSEYVNLVGEFLRDYGDTLAALE